MPTLERQMQNCLKIKKWINGNGFQFSKTKPCAKNSTEDEYITSIKK